MHSPSEKTPGHVSTPAAEFHSPGSNASGSTFQFRDQRASSAEERQLQTLMQRKAARDTITQRKPQFSAKSSAPIQLARWRLDAPNTWTGIDPENQGQTTVHPSGTHPLGSIYEDTSNVIINPTAPGGHALPSGSYGDWRKVARSDEQVDHFPPNAAYAGTPYAHIHPNHRPAFPIRNREGHRPAKGEEYGYGGHVSTTNSTFVQKGYTPDLRAMMMVGNYFGAMEKELDDKANVAFHQYGSRAAFNDLLRPAIRLAYQNGSINEEQYYHLLEKLHRYAERPKG